MKYSPALWLVGLLLTVPQYHVMALPGDVVAGFSSDSLKGSTSGTEPDVRTVVVQNDGKMIVGGDFVVRVPVTTTIGGNSSASVVLVLKNLVRLNSDGKVDKTFLVPEAKSSIEANGGWTTIGQAITWGFSGVVRSVVLNRDTPAVGQFKVLVGGDFQNFGQVGTGNVSSRIRLLQLDSDGGLDSDFTPTGTGINNTVRGLLSIDEDTVFSYGDFTKINETAVGYGFSGTSGGDASDWSAQVNGPIDFAMSTVDGLYLCGEFTTCNLSGNDTDTSTDPDTVTPFSFSSAAPRIVRVFPETFSFQPDPINTPDLTTTYYGGSIDTNFQAQGTGPNNAVRSMAMADDDSDIILVGAFTDYDGNTQGRIARVDNTGGLVGGFPAANSGNSDGANGEITSIIRLSDDRYLIAGTFTTYNGITVHGIARLESDGSLDQTFSTLTAPLTSGKLRGLAECPDGSYVAFGNFVSYKNSNTRGVVRIQGGRLPVITTQPVSVGANLGDSITLSVVATDNLLGLPTVETLQFQWQRNGKNIPGAISSTLDLGPLGINDGGAYRVIVRTSSSSITSNTAYVILSNPFLGIIPSTGFNAEGIVDPEPTLNNDQGGRITYTVDRFGAVSGSLTLGNGSAKPSVYRFTGQFSGSSATITIPRAGLGSLVLTLNSISLPAVGTPKTDFNFSDGTSLLSDGANTAVVSAWSNRWTKTTTASTYAGIYNVALQTDAGDLAATNFSGTRPVVSQGFSYFTMGVDLKGQARLAGVLADGTRFSGSALLWGDGKQLVAAPATLPLWVPLYKNGGSLTGTLSIDDAPADNTVVAALTWTKPAGLAKTPDVLGFDVVDLTAVVGSGQYNIAPLIPLAPATNVTLNFDDGVWTAPNGGLSAAFSQGFSILNLKSTTVLPSPKTVTLNFNSKTGLSTGGFVDDGRKVKYQTITLTVGGLRFRGNYFMPNSAVLQDYLVGGSVSN
ncbi:MAG: hypothetical protein SFU85_06440 [Candidatus Methylacidiphilales bacterium]|nr:hypothetical protein [Candidatus Methylacidiphilales bacterium]